MIAAPRLRKDALTVITALATLPCAAQPPAPPITVEDILLTTKTPLGEAAIIRPAGSVVTEPVGADGKIVLQEGPFTAQIDRADLVFPVPPAPSPAPGTAAAESPSTTAESSKQARWQDDWRILVPTGTAVALGIYSLVATVALVRRHRRWDD